MSDFGLRFEFSGELWGWRGPAPYYFVTVPEEESERLKEIVRSVTYGWGMIPVTARIGEVEWTTALWPKDGLYIVPIKKRVRLAAGVGEGDPVRMEMTVGIDAG